MDVQILGSGFFSFRNAGTHLGLKNLGTSASQRVEASRLKLSKRLKNRQSGQPSQMQNLDRGKAFQLQTRIQRFECSEKT